MDFVSESTRRPTKKRKSDTPSANGPATKRARTAKKGRLSGLLDISLDIVFEIFGNLHPLDLLRISRISKEFRNLLMHKSSRHIWKSSLSSVVPTLPPCAPGMTEPQWVSLVFDTTCYVCQKTARKADWGLFIRICNKCAKSHLGSGMLFSPESEKTDFMSLIPTRRDAAKPYRKVWFKKELESIKTKCNAIQGAEEKRKFVEDRKELVSSLKEHTTLCEAWAETIAESRSSELADLKEERFAAITAKLISLGWGMELDNIQDPDSLRSHKHVKQPNPLTERTWKTIKPDLLIFMELMKKKRLDRELAALVVERKAIAGKVLRTFKRSQLPWTDIMPGVSDFLSFPEIKAVIDQAFEVEVDEQSFEALLPAFPGMIATWRESIVKLLVHQRKRLCKDQTEDDEEIMRQLKLATSVFKCHSCGDDAGDPYFDSIMYHNDGHHIELRCRPLFWPRVLAHRCATRPYDYGVSLMSFLDLRRDVPWTSNVFLVDSQMAEIVKKIVILCGKDPSTTTVDDMDAADYRFACHTCADRDPVPDSSKPSTSNSAPKETEAAAEGPALATVRAFSWRHAARHEMEGHWRKPTAWVMLNEADAAAARAAEVVVLAEEGHDEKINTVQDVVDNAIEVADAAEDPDVSMQDEAAGDSARMLPSQLPEVAWSCAHCMDTTLEKPPMTLDVMLDHLIVRHGIIGRAVLNEDYYRTLAAPEVYTKGHFPAPSLKVLMPPAPPLEAPTPFGRSGFPFPYLYGDSDSDDDGYDGYDFDFW